MNDITRILFVCTGNICRSPLAEALLEHELGRRGLKSGFEVDSGGTDAYHVGEPADPRMRKVAKRHGVSVLTRSRQVDSRDLDHFDHIFAMDTGHHRALSRYASDERAAGKIRLFRDYDPVTTDHNYPNVPDPWYGGIEGFENVYAIVSRTCVRIADALVDHQDD